MEKMVRLVAIDSDTLEPLYDIDGDGNPTFNCVLLPFTRALELQKEAYRFQGRVETGWRNDFVIEC